MTYHREIVYDRETRDYTMYLDGELVGFGRTYHEAEVTLDQLVFELLNTPQALPAIVEEVAPIEPPTTCCFCHKPHSPSECSQVRHISLGDGEYTVVSPEDYDSLIAHDWYIHSNGYVRATINHEHVYLHRLILEIPIGHVTDHINGNKLDNRRVNLRSATHRQNAQNHKPKGGSSKYIGVRKTKEGKWNARIRNNGKEVYLGNFASETEAAWEHDRAAVEYHGEFARLNFTEQYPCKNCKGLHAIQQCPEMRALLFAPDLIVEAAQLVLTLEKLMNDHCADWQADGGFSPSALAFFLKVCRIRTKAERRLQRREFATIPSMPLDVDFVSVSPEV